MGEGRGKKNIGGLRFCFTYVVPMNARAPGSTRLTGALSARDWHNLGGKIRLFNSVIGESGNRGKGRVKGAAP